MTDSANGEHSLIRRVLWNRKTQTGLSFALFFALWELAVVVFDIRPYILPAPTAIFRALIKYHGELFYALLFTVKSLVFGYIIAVVFGILFSLPVAFSKFIRRAVYPLILVFQVIPKIALAPIFVIWFGFGLLPKIMIVFLLSFFPVLINGITGLRSIDQDIINLTRSTGARGIDVFFKVRLPGALPSFFAGFKLAAIAATIGAVIGEFIGSDAGLGYVILTANGDLQTDYAFAAITVLTVLGLTLYYLVEQMEQILLPWHISQRGRID
ncbi:MAG: ABC transporter permease [Phycisphaerae bacterium]|nr:ABC transporter permease [Phycisphaerae bacterium]